MGGSPEVGWVTLALERHPAAPEPSRRLQRRREPARFTPADQQGSERVCVRPQDGGRPRTHPRGSGGSGPGSGRADPPTAFGRAGESDPSGCRAGPGMPHRRGRECTTGVLRRGRAAAEETGGGEQRGLCEAGNRQNQEPLSGLRAGGEGPATKGTQPRAQWANRWRPKGTNTGQRGPWRR